jgi:hypothetical protein
VKLRFQVARLPGWYLQLGQNQVTGEARTALVQRFLAIARQAGLSSISEGQSRPDWARKQGVE